MINLSTIYVQKYFRRSFKTSIFSLVFGRLQGSSLYRKPNNLLHTFSLKPPSPTNSIFLSNTMKRQNPSRNGTYCTPPGGVQTYLNKLFNKLELSRNCSLHKKNFSHCHLRPWCALTHFGNKRLFCHLSLACFYWEIVLSPYNIFFGDSTISA